MSKIRFNRAAKTANCMEFFNKLAELLCDRYEMTGSPYTGSVYLVPKGKVEEVSWYGKPEMSFRSSDHWNWYANPANCPDLDVVQCYTRDLKHPLKRTDNEHGTRPRIASCVAIYQNGEYHVVYGERRIEGKIRWKWSTPEEVVEKYF